MKRTSLVLLFFVFFLGILFPKNSYAEYLVTGEVTGEECSRFPLLIAETCSHRIINAYKGDDGNLYELPKSFPDVSEFNERNNRCWIRMKSKGLGLLSNLSNFVTGTDFYQKTKSGSFDKVDANYITFSCAKL